MEIVNSYPPNIERIREVLNPPATACFAYGDKIYNPSGNPIDTALLAHEQVHKKQQGDDPEGWWEEYLTDAQFRLSQEVAAYRKQIATLREDPSFKTRMVTIIHAIAKELSGEMYGNITTYSKARKMIS